MVVHTKAVKLYFFGKPFEVPEGNYAILEGNILTGFTGFKHFSTAPGELVALLERTYKVKHTEMSKIKEELSQLTRAYKEFSAFPQPDNQNTRAAVHNTINLLEEMLKNIPKQYTNL